MGSKLGGGCPTEEEKEDNQQRGRNKDDVGRGELERGRIEGRMTEIEAPRPLKAVPFQTAENEADLEARVAGSPTSKANSIRWLIIIQKWSSHK